jgi:hypothetical protein
MHRFAIVFLALSIAARTASPNVVDVLATDTWSATSKGSVGFDFGFAGIDEATNLKFNLSAIPTGATITGATLTILDVTTNWAFPPSNAFGCVPPVGPATIFVEIMGCSDVSGAQWTDDIFVDGFAPDGTAFGNTIDLLFSPENGPYTIDPSAIPAHGAYSVSIFEHGAMDFGDFDDFGDGAPELPTFTMNGTVDGELEVQFSPGQTSTTPEPGYTVLLGMLLIPLAGVALKRRRAAASQPE